MRDNVLLDQELDSRQATVRHLQRQQVSVSNSMVPLMKLNYVRLLGCKSKTVSKLL